MQWWVIACERLKKRYVSSFLLSHWCCPSIVLLRWFVIMVVSGRMPPGLSVMYKFVSFSVRVVLVEADLSHSNQSVGSKHRSQSKERNTQIKIVFLSTQKQLDWVDYSSVGFYAFVLPPKRQMIVFYAPAPIFYFIFLFYCYYLPRLSSSDVRLGMEIIELCQSKHEIIQKKSPSPIFSCSSLSDVTANLNCWRRGDQVAW